MKQDGKVEAPLFKGCRVEFTYQHYLNSKSKTWITKQGTVIRHIRSQKGTHLPTGFVLVKFDKNKTASKIHETRLKNLSI